MKSIWWIATRILITASCATYWIALAYKDIWPAGLFAAGWVFFFIDGTHNEIQNYKLNKRQAIREAKYAERVDMKDMK